MVAGNGFIPGVQSPDQLKDRAHPCRGAVPRKHSHFFTKDGRFGSLDWNGQDVDDGTYTLKGTNRVVIAKEIPVGDVHLHRAGKGDQVRAPDRQGLLDVPLRLGRVDGDPRDGLDAPLARARLDLPAGGPGATRLGRP